MAELLEANKVFYTPYEPKLKNRFIMEIDGIPAFTIKTMQRPQITFDEVVLEHMNVTRYVKGKGRWQTLQITLYDPIVPSASQDVYKKNINFQVLGPVGDIIEKWTLYGTYISDAAFGDLDFSDSNPVEITLTLRYDYAILEF